MGESEATNGGAIDPRANRLLRGLSDAELERIRPALEVVHLARPTELEGANEDIHSVVMRQFEDAGLVHYARGKISIADRDGLLARSCDCINVIASEARRLDTLERSADDAH